MNEASVTVVMLHVETIRFFVIEEDFGVSMRTGCTTSKYMGVCV